ncbi:MAG: peptidoglycan-binding protein, partial [Nocardioidaceae bacterium]
MTELHAAPAIFRRGDRGDAVVEIRSRLARLDLIDADAGEPDVFDATLDRAVRAFQQLRGLTADGVVGSATYKVLDEARWRLGDRLLTFVAGNVISGDDVVALQQRLLDLGFKVGRVDGRYGDRTEQAVRDFQRNVGVPPDGTCGPATLKALGRLAPMVRGGSPNAMRAEERLRRLGPQLTGKIVVVDPSVGTIDDPELRGLADAITYDLA